MRKTFPARLWNRYPCNDLHVERCHGRCTDTGHFDGGPKGQSTTAPLPLRLRPDCECGLVRSANLEPSKPRRLPSRDAAPWPMAARIRYTLDPLDCSDLCGDAPRIQEGPCRANRRN